jgi:hypothetical protein
MKRSELEHVLRAATAIAQETSFVVVGSQAILMAFPHAPQELLVSREIDLYPALHPEKADLIDGAIGAMLSLSTMVERIALLDGAKYPLAHITQWTQRRAQEANL